MKYFDKVKVLKDYPESNILVGEIGWINEPEIRDSSFDVYFETGDEYDLYKSCAIKIEDLELIEESKITDEQILLDLPKQDPHWWCKVENGYILNLLGEKKNKIPFDYNS